MAILKSVGFVGLFFGFGILITILMPGGGIWITVVADLLTIAVCGLYYFLRVRPDNKLAREVMSERSTTRLLQDTLGFFFAWGIFELTVSFALSYFTDPRFEAYNDFLDASDMFGVLFGTVLVAPIAEEILMRGIVLDCLSRRYNQIVGIIVSSIVFAVVHGTFVHMYFAFGVGILFGLIYLRSRSITSSCLAHVACNFMGIFLSALFYGFELPSGIGFGAALLILNIIIGVCMAYHVSQLHVCYEWDNIQVHVQEHFERGLENHGC